MAKAGYHRKPQVEDDAPPKTRRCLKCREPFVSGWSGERICRKCKSSTDWRENGFSHAGFGRHV